VLDQRTKSRFQPSDPSAVKTRFARIKARAFARADDALREIKPLKESRPRTALPSPLRRKQTA
jgi:hypothetical protein